MTKLTLSKRLSLIASMVEKDAVIADVGCDHALLDIYLSQNKIIKRSIASDVAKGAIKQAENNIKISNVDNVETRLGDGLETIKETDEVSTIVISGLGSQKIISILKSNINKIKNVSSLIIQANTGYKNIRKEVTKLGYYVSDEALVKERDIIYVVIKFKRGRRKYNRRQLFFGPVLLTKKDELFNEMIKAMIEKNNDILRKLPNKMLIRKFKLNINNNKLKKEIQR